MIFLIFFFCRPGTSTQMSLYMVNLPMTVVMVGVVDLTSEVAAFELINWVVKFVMVVARVGRQFFPLVL